MDHYLTVKPKSTLKIYNPTIIKLNISVLFLLKIYLNTYYLPIKTQSKTRTERIESHE